MKKSGGDKKPNIENGIIKGVKPSKDEVQSIWDAPLNDSTIRELKHISDRAKDKKPTLKQLKMFEDEK